MSVPSLKPDAVQEQIEEGPARYAAYAMRLRTLVTASSRYIAYSSDIGEAFRPLTSPNFVRAAYGISWAYLIGDVGYAGYKASQTPPALSTDPSLPQNETARVGLVVARRAVFQSIASMALPAFTIHSIVRYSAPLFARSSLQRVRNAGPTVAGLLFVPALPYLFDEPVEHVVDKAFEWIEEKYEENTKTKTSKTEL